MCSCMGSTLNPFSGAYRYICEKYDLNFYTFSRENTFDKVCKVAIKELKDKIEEMIRKYLIMFLWMKVKIFLNHL